MLNYFFNYIHNNLDYNIKIYVRNLFNRNEPNSIKSPHVHFFNKNKTHKYTH